MGYSAYSYWPTPEGRAALTPPAADQRRCLVGAASNPAGWCPNLARPGEFMCEDHDPEGRWHRGYVAVPDTRKLRSILEEGCP